MEGGIKIVIGELPEGVDVQQLSNTIAATIMQAMGHDKKKSRKADFRRRGEIVFGMNKERCCEIGEALETWVKKTEEFHSVELYEYAVTLAKQPDDLFYIGVACGKIVAETAVGEG